MRIICGRQTVSVPSEPVRLVTSPQTVAWLNLFALATNTGRIAVGDDRVSEQTRHLSGLPLDPDDCLTLADVELSELYIDAAVADEGVRWIAQING